MNRSKSLVAALIVVLVLLGAGSCLMFGKTLGLSYANADQYTAGDTEITSAVEHLDINWTSGKVIIEYHSGSGVSVRETANKTLSDDDKLHWWLDGTTLRVQYAKPGIRYFWNNWNLQKTLTVSLPEGTVLKSAKIDATAADLEIGSLAADEILLDTTAGDIAASTAAKKLVVSSTSGKMDIRQDSPMDSVKLTATAGSIFCRLADAKEINADTTAGSIDMTVTGSAKNISLDSTAGSVTLRLPTEPGFTCRVSTTAGSFNSPLSLQKDGKTYTCGDGSIQCSISTTAGSVRLDKAE